MENIFIVLGMQLLFVQLSSQCQYSGQMSARTLSRVRRDTTTTITCNATYPYRSMDGSCNNLLNPTFGRTGATFRRIMDAAYGGDGKGSTPRQNGVSGNPLPSPRDISVLIHDAENFTIPSIGQMVMQWGQFLDHDITWTPEASNASVCCYDELVTSDAVHPDVTSGGSCFPIIIDEEDRYFDTVSSRCMVFYRSDPVTDSNGVRQQYNAVTPWIDGSQIYGDSDDEASKLRSKAGGKLLVKTIGTEDFLPEAEGAGDDICFKRETGDYCFLAGDHRVNVFVGLSALHTIFLRYHNKMCDRLQALHSDWDDEKLYQESRRIVVAVLQVISYRDFLRQILGSTVLNTNDLGIDDDDYSYDNTIDPTLSNVFSTAAYRFGHSMISDSYTVSGQIYQASDLLMRPTTVLKSVGDVVDGIVNEPLHRTDRWYTEAITDRMFEKPGEPQSGFDIAARNIQRGRDHGLPSYNAWREKFGFAKKTDFDDIDQGDRRYPRLFESVDDIDLYSGGISENTIAGGKVGELYAAIIAEQFKSLKFGDRFWFENESSGEEDETTGYFTSDQITQLRRASLSRVLCDTIEGITTVIKNPFRTYDESSNPLVSCDNVRDMNIERRW